MQDSFSDKGAIERFPWCSIQLDWPYESVIAELQVIASKEPHALQRIVVRILEAFADTSPSLAEATRYLGLADEVFLRRTLQELLALGVVEQIDPAAALDLPTCRLTPKGQQMLEGQPTEGSPERHGMRVCFDAITAEHVGITPKHAKRVPTNPVVCLEELPPRMSHIGLDRARQLARLQNEPSQREGASIRDVIVDVEQGQHLWMPLRLDLEVHRTGMLGWTLHGAGPSQREWFARRDLQIPPMENLAIESVKAIGIDLLPAVALDTWIARVQRLVSPFAVRIDAERLIESARSELVLHPAWLEVPGIEKAMTRAAQRGVRCLEPHLASPWPIACVSDGFQALCLDRILVHTATGRELTLAVASHTTRGQVSDIRNGLLQETSVMPAA